MEIREGSPPDPRMARRRDLRFGDPSLAAIDHEVATLEPVPVFNLVLSRSEKNGRGEKESNDDSILSESSLPSQRLLVVATSAECYAGVENQVAFPPGLQDHVMRLGKGTTEDRSHRIHNLAFGHPGAVNWQRDHNPTVL